MRVCLVAYTFYLGDNRVKRYAEALAQRGDQVDVIALRREGMPLREIINQVNVYQIQKRAINEKNKISYVIRLILFLFKSAMVLTIKHELKPYDVIHVHSVPDFEVFAAWWPKLSGAKIILDIHDLVPELYAGKFNVSENSWLFKSLKVAEKASSAFSHHVIIANHLWWETLTARSVKPEKCSVFLNYPDRTIFRPRPKTELHDKFIMMYPGSLVWHQGLDVALKALALVKNDYPNMKFKIYGEGPEKRNLESLIHVLELNDIVVFEEMLPLEGIAETMAQVDLGLVPKRKQSFGNEAFSTKIFEFMSVGTPVLIADTKIDQYYFNDSVVQFFESGNEHDLAKKLFWLIKHPNIRKRLAQNSLNFIEKYNWQAHQKRYFELLDNLCHCPKN